jgi:flagellar motor switch protein FliG
MPLAVKTKTDIKQLSGTDKVAILFLCIDEKRSAKIMGRMTPQEITHVTRSLAGLGVVANNVVEDVITEFLEQMVNGTGLVGNVGAAEKILLNFMGSEDVSNLMKEVKGPLQGKNLWTRFSALNESTIASYLKNENPQTAAAILSKVKPDVIARVLPLLEKNLLQDIVSRMIAMEPVPQDFLNHIEATLHEEFMNSAARTKTIDPLQQMADIFNKLDPDLFENLSAGLEIAMPDAIRSIKQKMFTFDDLIRIDVQAIGKIMRAGSEGNMLATALKGAKPELRDFFLSALPERARNMLSEEMRTMGPVRRRDVQDAQTALVDIAKDLAAEGAIALPVNDGDEEIVE